MTTINIGSGSAETALFSSSQRNSSDMESAPKQEIMKSRNASIDTTDKCADLDGHGTPLIDFCKELTDADDNLCPYCNRDFRSPRVLHCLHSMCEDCIIAQLDSVESAEKSVPLSVDCIGYLWSNEELESADNVRRITPPGVIRCPECSQESHIGNDVRFVSLILPDYLRCHDLERRKYANQARKCRSCKSEPEAVAVCIDCNCDLCGGCVSAHSIMRAFEGHKVLSYAELTKDMSLLPRGPQMCLLHPTELYSRYCLKCNKIVCTKCEIESHSDFSHEIAPADERLSTLFKSELREVLDTVRTKTDASSEFCSSIPSRLRTLHANHEMIMSQIEEAFADYINAMDEVKRNILKQLSERRDDIETCLNEMSAKSDATTARVNDAMKFTKRLISEASPIELIASKQLAKQQLQSLLHTLPNSVPSVELIFARLPYSQFVEQASEIVGKIQNQDAHFSIPSTNSTMSRVGSSGTLNTLFHRADTTPTTELYQQPLYNAKSSSVLASAALNDNYPFGNRRLSNTIAAPGPVGVERRSRPPSENSAWQNSANEYSGWPPSSHPPESVISVQNGLKMKSISGCFEAKSSSDYVWPPHSNPPPAEPRYLNGNKLQTSVISGSSASGVMHNPNHIDPSWMRSSSLLSAGMMGQNSVGNASFPITTSVVNTSSDTFVDQGNHLFTGKFDGFNANSGLVSSMSVASQLSLTPDKFIQSRNTNDRSFIQPMSVPRSISQGNGVLMNILHVGGGGSTPGCFNLPHGFSIGSNEELIIADTHNNRVQILSKTGDFMREFGGYGFEDGYLYSPKKAISITLPNSEEAYLVVDKKGNCTRLQLFRRDGTFICRIPAPPLQFEYLSALTTDQLHRIVLFSNNAYIHISELDINLEVHVAVFHSCAPKLIEPSDVIAHGSYYYVTDFKQHAVVVVDAFGSVMRVIGAGAVPYPIGIFARSEDEICVGSSHMNHFQVNIFSVCGISRRVYTCKQMKVTRCIGLGILSDGRIVTMSKTSNAVLFFRIGP